eukprot:TRINITY_DN3104_c0_g1_i1.p1 TRINITY_DN3104_c0_g1~~TRINITY_DN3104_c0_g1_i1.p1  ORF type:complete len:599 (+),score=161.82 TRINITY_DN3104_c0_g1_i1:71-1867(+)
MNQEYPKSQQKNSNEIDDQRLLQKPLYDLKKIEELASPLQKRVKKKIVRKHQPIIVSSVSGPWNPLNVYKEDEKPKTKQFLTKSEKIRLKQRFNELATPLNVKPKVRLNDNVESTKNRKKANPLNFSETQKMLKENQQRRELMRKEISARKKQKQESLLQKKHDERIKERREYLQKEKAHQEEVKQKLDDRKKRIDEHRKRRPLPVKQKSEVELTLRDLDLLGKSYEYFSVDTPHSLNFFKPSLTYNVNNPFLDQYISNLPTSPRVSVPNSSTKKSATKVFSHGFERKKESFEQFDRPHDSSNLQSTKFQSYQQIESTVITDSPVPISLPEIKPSDMIFPSPSVIDPNIRVFPNEGESMERKLKIVNGKLLVMDSDSQNISSLNDDIQPIESVEIDLDQLDVEVENFLEDDIEVEEEQQAIDLDDNISNKEQPTSPKTIIEEPKMQEMEEVQETVANLQTTKLSSLDFSEKSADSIDETSIINDMSSVQTTQPVIDYVEPSVSDFSQSEDDTSYSTPMKTNEGSTDSIASSSSVSTPLGYSSYSSLESNSGFNSENSSANSTPKNISSTNGSFDNSSPSASVDSSKKRKRKKRWVQLH